MPLAIGLVLLVLAVSLLTIMVVVLRMASRMGDETPGWARVHRHLPIGRQREAPPTTAEDRRFQSSRASSPSSPSRCGQPVRWSAAPASARLTDVPSREGDSQSRDRSYFWPLGGGLGCRVKQIESGRAGLARTAHGTTVTIARCRIHCRDISISVESSHATLSIQVMLRWAGSR
jgi:hypothetical protein